MLCSCCSRRLCFSRRIELYLYSKFGTEMFERCLWQRFTKVDFSFRVGKILAIKVLVARQGGLMTCGELPALIKFIILVARTKARARLIRLAHGCQVRGDQFRMQLISSSNQPLISRFIATGCERRRVSGKKSARKLREWRERGRGRVTSEGRVGE